MVKLDDLGYTGTLLDTVESDTQPDVKYEIRWSKKGGYHCECASTLKCKHIKRYEFLYRLDNAFSAYDKRNKTKLANLVLKLAKEIWEV